MATANNPHILISNSFYNVCMTILEHIDVDPCGHPESPIKAPHVCLGTSKKDDGMRSSWSSLATEAKDSRVFLHPVFGDRLGKNVKDVRFFYPINHWLMKTEVEFLKGATILGLLPAWTGAAWFHQYVGSCNAFTLLQKSPLLATQTNKKYGFEVGHTLAIWTHNEAVLGRYFEVMDSMGLVVEPSP